MHPLKHRHATLLTGLYNAFPVIDTQTNTLTCTHINGCMFGRGLVSGLRTQAPLKQLGIKLLTFQLVCDLLSLLRHSCPKKHILQFWFPLHQNVLTSLVEDEEDDLFSKFHDIQLPPDYRHRAWPRQKSYLRRKAWCRWTLVLAPWQQK